MDHGLDRLVGDIRNLHRFKASIPSKGVLNSNLKKTEILKSIIFFRDGIGQNG